MAKWTKDKILTQLQNIKLRDGYVNSAHIRKISTPLRGAIDRLFDSYSDALIFAGFSLEKEKGDRGGFRGKKHSLETRRILSEKRKGRFVGMDNHMFGKKHTNETRQKISQKSKDWHNSNPDWQIGYKNHMFGKTQSTESNSKRSKSLLEYNSQFDKRPYTLTDEGRKRIQAGRAKAIANQKSCCTNIEIIITDVLNNMGIHYEFQYPFQYFCVDFYLLNHNCVVWCDGDYWHSNPCTTIILSDRQKQQRRLDKSQESYLRNRGIRFLRLWEKDIKNSLEICKMEIKQLIGGV